MGDCNAYEFRNVTTMADCNTRELHKDGECNATTMVDYGALELRNDGECNPATMANWSARELCNDGERNAATMADCNAHELRNNGERNLQWWRTLCYNVVLQLAELYCLEAKFCFFLTSYYT